MAYFSNNQPISNISILSVQTDIARVADGYHFIMVLNGDVVAKMEEQRFLLAKNDIVMAPAGKTYQLSAEGNNLVLIVGLRKEFFEQGQSKHLGKVICNSYLDKSRDYMLVRSMLSRIAATYYDNADNNGLELHEICYAFLLHLNRNHFEPDVPESPLHERDSKRKYDIVHYIDQNYMLPISLQELAEELDLTTNYLSKYFRQSLGKNFHAYLSETRLKHAVDDLDNTDLPITAIAFNNGFANINSFISYFKQQFGVTPSRYRQDREGAQETEKPDDGAIVIDYRTVEDIIGVAGAQQADTEEGGPKPFKEKRIAIEGIESRNDQELIWKSMINVGFVRNAADSGLQAQLALAQREIGFKYCRVQGVLSPEILPLLPNQEGFNYSEFDKFIKSILRIGLVPFLDLSSRSHYLFYSTMEYFFTAADNSNEPVQESHYLNGVSQLIRHCIKAFGENEVEQWGFEIGYQHGTQLNLLETPAAFVGRFEKTYNLIKELIPEALVGGVSHNTGLQPSLMAGILDLMDEQSIRPDFFSITVFPYAARIGESLRDQYVLSADTEIALHRVDAINTLLSGHKNQTKDLFVTVFGPDVNARNMLNDTCFQASFITKNTLDLVGKVKVLGYWQLSDIEAAYNDTNRLLFGGTGIVSKDGIIKPGFLAIKQMSGLQENVIQKGDGYIATTNKRNRYDIVLYNYIHFNGAYRVSNARPTKLEEAYKYFDEPTNQEIVMEISGVQDGVYKVISISLNRKHGSLMDEWIKYGVLDDLQPKELEYLQDIIHPQQLAQFITAVDGKLTIREKLLPHEVKHCIVVRDI